MIRHAWLFICAIIIGFTLILLMRASIYDAVVIRDGDRERSFVATHDCTLTRHIPPKTKFDSLENKVVSNRGLSVYSCAGVADTVLIWDRDK